MKKGFTMIELVMVITIIGILAAIAVPKFAVTRDDAVISKAKNTVAALRSALAMKRQKNILEGNFTEIDAPTLAKELEYGLDKDWTIDSNNNAFIFSCPMGGKCTFKIENGKLIKDTCDSDCKMDDL